MPFIGDITPSKNGTFTPGTKIPIISMEEAKSMSPDYFLVLPWAFRSDILLRESETIKSGVKFIFPLPFVEIVAQMNSNQITHTDTIDYSIVIPVYQNEGSLDETFRKLKKYVIDKNRQYSSEIIFVDDGSTDNSFQILKKL